MNIYLLAALLSPLFFAMMNVVDKYVISHKVDNDNAFLSYSGMVYLTYSIMLASFLDWKNIQITDCIFPVIIGIIVYIQTYFYMKLQHREDISHVTGLEYTYPIIVAILAYIFLKEIIPTQGYIGMSIVILGALILTTRFKKMGGSMMPILGLITFVALNEFTMKISSSHISPFNGVVISWFTWGMLQILRLTNRETRKLFVKQTRKVFFIVLANEVAGFLGLTTVYFAMSGMPATIVSSIAAAQVLFVLLLEGIFNRYIIIIKDKVLWPKLFGIIMIIAGVVLLTLSI